LKWKVEEFYKKPSAIATIPLVLMEFLSWRQSIDKCSDILATLQKGIVGRVSD
jgi:hypothetical protein